MRFLNSTTSRAGLALLLWGALLVSGCSSSKDDVSSSYTGSGSSGGGGSGAPSATITGTAATGAPMAGATVTVIGANGTSASATTAANGSYSITVSGLDFPALLSATGAGVTHYSWALAAGTANITPLTTIALITNPNLDNNLPAVFANWAAHAANVTAQVMTNAQAVVNANLQAQFTAAGVNYQIYDFLSALFPAIGSGIDAVLDGLDFNFVLANGTFTVTLNGTSTVVPFNPAISIVGIDIGGTGGGGGGGGGSASAVNVVASNASPASGNVSIDSGTTIAVEQYSNGVTSVEVLGVVDGLEREVKVYFVTATGFVNAVGYRWRPVGGDDIGNANCYDPAIAGFPTCAGVSVDTAAKVITFNNAYLASIYIVSNATLNGTVNFTP